MKRCPFHPDSKHSAKECRNLQKAVGNFLPEDKGKKKDNEEEEDKEDAEKTTGYQDTNRTVNVIFGGEGCLSRRVQKLMLREILAVELATLKYLKLSEVPTSFSREDQWTSFSEPGKLPMVLDPVVVGVRLTKVLIDGSSSLNILFASTLRQMGLDFSKINPTKSPFYGIVPGNAAMPLGTISLPITFGTRENYCTEYIKFEVANFNASYHAILGRPAMARFMAIPHYIYLLLKMPEPKGVLSLRGDIKKSFDCDKGAIQCASNTRVPNTAGEVLAATQQLLKSGIEIPIKKLG